MTDHDNSERASRSYAVAFKVGAIGSIVLAVGALLGSTLAWLTALAVWCLVILFVLPWLYVLYCEKLPRFSMPLVRGPHQ